MVKKELIVKTKYEELYKTEYGYWIEHIEYEDDAETVRFEGGGCSISNEVVDKLLDRAREEGRREVLEDMRKMWDNDNLGDAPKYGSAGAGLMKRWIRDDINERLSKLTTK